MTETEFLALITQDSAARVLEVLAEIPENERRAFARTAHATLKSYHKAKWDRQTGGTSEPGQIAKDGDALDIAVLAAGVPSEIAAHRWPVLPNTIKITEVFQALKPSWIDRWAEAAVEDNPQMLRTVQQLYRQGLCRLPDTDAYILGYYADRQSADWRAGDEFQQRDVWRFFEVEGGGEFCLASHDKYTVEVNSWSTTLLALCAKDALDRGRLLDATLDTLERDFGQFQAGWYSRFHMRLEPTLKEMTARVGRYLNLLGSMVPPTVSLALKILKQVDKTGAILPDDLLASVGPALQARQKSSALAALLLLKSCAKRHKERAADIARTAALALISEAGEVQERALDLIDQLGQSQNPDLRAVFAEYVDAVTPVVRERLSDLLGTQSANVGETPAYPVPQLKAIIPVGSAEEAVSTFLELLENCRDPFLIERAMDGVARFGAAAAAQLSPVAKRAKQLRKRVIDSGYSTGQYFQRPISGMALAWANGTAIETELQPFYEERFRGDRPDVIADASFEGLFTERSEELLGFVRAGHTVPMLSAPTDNRGYLDPTALVARLKEYRSLGLLPGAADFRLALMRLGPENRTVALAGFIPETEVERTFAYALGAEMAPGKDKQLWAIAWSSRLPVTADPRIQKLVGGKIAGAGTPAIFEFDAYKYQSGQYFWPKPRIKMSPAIPNPADETLSFGLLHKFEPLFSAATYPGWMKTAHAWVSVLRPAHSELFFATGIAELELDQKLADHPCQAFLEPFFRPGLHPGPMAHALLAWYLAAADGAIGAVTTDAMATLIATQGFDADAFGDAAGKLIFQGGLPLRRWTQRMRDVSAMSPQHAGAVRAALGTMLVMLPQDVPRDLGGILELLFELHVATGTCVQNAELLRALEGITAGGKIGKFAKQLAKLGPK